jgi:hypothetical protein
LEEQRKVAPAPYRRPRILVSRLALRQPGQKWQFLVRLHDAEAVTEPEVCHPIRAKHPTNIGHHGIGVHYMLVNVIEDNNINGLCGHEDRVAACIEECDLRAEPLPCLRQSRVVDVEPGDLCACLMKCVSNKTRGASDV